MKKVELKSLDLDFESSNCLNGDYLRPRWRTTRRTIQIDDKPLIGTARYNEESSSAEYAFSAKQSTWLVLSIDP